MKSVSAGSRSRVASTKSVPSTLETNRNVMVAVAVVLERLVGHHRPEVGAADADVDDVANSLAGVALPGPVAHPVGEVRHLLEHRVDLGHHVLAIDDDRCAFWGAQGHVQDGSVFGDVDLLAANMASIRARRPDSSASCRSSFECFVGDAILRVIEENARSLERHPLAAVGIISEELPKVQFPDLLMVGLRVPSMPGVR